MDGKIDINAPGHVTDKLRERYRKASKPDEGRILDEVAATTTGLVELGHLSTTNVYDVCTVMKSCAP